MASCGSTQGAKLPRPGPGLSATRDRQGSLDPRGSCLHSSAWWQGDCMPSAPLWCPGCPPAEARKEKPEAEQAPAPQRTYGSREPATHSALTGSPKALSLAGSCRRQACSPARHPTCLTCLTSRSLHPPGPQVPRLPFLFSASVWLPTAVPPARAQRPGRAGPAHLHPRAAGASPPPMRGRVGPGLLRAAG